MPAYDKLVRIHCKAGSVSARFVFETRAKCQEFVARYKDDGIPYEVDGPFCQSRTNITVRQSKSHEDKEIGKQFAPFWKALSTKLLEVFPEGDDAGAFIVPAPDARSHVLSIKDRRNGIGKPVFKFVPFGSAQLFTLVALTTGHLSSQYGQCVMAALSPPRFFAAWRVEAPFFCGFPFRWVLHFAIFSTRCLTVCDAVFCPMEDPLYECGRPYDTMSSLFSTAIWLQRSQSILVHEFQPAKDIDLTCYKTLPTKAITCLPIEVIFLEWPVALPSECEQSCPSSSHEDSNDDHLENTLPALPHSRWRRDALQPPQVQHGTAGRYTCAHFTDEGLRCITWNAGGLVGSVFCSQKNRELKLKYFGKIIDNNNIICLQEGRMSFSRQVFWYFHSR